MQKLRAPCLIGKLQYPRISRHFLSSLQLLYCMNKLCIFAGTLLGSYGGWFLGEALGLGFWWSFVISGIGSVVGVWAGWKVARKLE